MTTQKTRYTVSAKLQSVFERLSIEEVKDYEKYGVPRYNYYSYGPVRQHLPCCSDVARRFLDDYAMAGQKITKVSAFKGSMYLFQNDGESHFVCSIHP